VSGLAQNGTLLITARGLQGFGAALIAPAALSILTNTFAEGPERLVALGVWGTFPTIGGLVGVAVLLSSFLLIESRSASPMTPLRIFRLKTLRTANISAVLVFGTFGALLFFASIFMQQVYGYSPLKAGFAYVPLAVCVAAAPGSPRPWPPERRPSRRSWPDYRLR
jgi:MFS family permease